MFQDYKFLSAVSINPAPSAATSFWKPLFEKQLPIYKKAIQAALAKKSSDSGRGVDQKIAKLIETATHASAKNVGQPAIRFIRVESDLHGNSCEWSVTITTTEDLSEILNTRVNVRSTPANETHNHSAS